MRALVVTNMYPTPEHPALGSFVRDQVRALSRLPGVEVEVFSFAPGGAGAYVRAARELRRQYRHEPFDIVHAHFGLTAWPSLALRGVPHAVTVHGTDLFHPRSRPVTLAALRFIDLVAAVSEPLAQTIPERRLRRPVAVLPCGVDTERFKPISRAEARRALGLAEDGPYLLFPSDPARAEKRYDRAVSLAGAAPLLVLRDVDPNEVPLWVNAANAVLVPSEREGFGLATLEALACEVPVFSTPVGIAPEVLEGLANAYCGPFELERWSELLAPLLTADDPRVQGRARAEALSAEHMAERVLGAWKTVV